MNQKRVRILIYTAPIMILSIPLIAMHFTKEVEWTSFDFFIAGILIFTTAALIDYTIKTILPIKKAFIICSVIIVIFMFIWAELAVGIF
ncbi:MAG TPA: hypothetical protein PKD85_17745 [Saprospiraceae bacterium]|nr:hypothetical protein [Saprospiraceae bacterium]